MIERTMPYFELKNTSEEAEIKQLSISIGDVSKNFDWGKLIEASPGVSFSLVTPDAIVGGAKADTLVINFDGLVPGDFVRFRTGLSADAAGSSMIQDYRMVLFKLDGNDASSNSLVSVKFASDQGEKSLEKQMPNFGMMGMSTSTTMAFPHHYMDMIMPFTLTDSGTIAPDNGGDNGDGDDGGGSTPVVPEPGSVVLLGTGLVGLVVWRCRRRRRR
jgi:PEP-CTERM motif